jgi:hypothetical protein
MFPYCGKISRHGLGLWFIVRANYYAMPIQAAMGLHRYFANGKKIFTLKGIRISISNQDNARFTKILMLLTCQEDPGPTLFSGTCSATASMGERLGVCGRIELQNDVHIGDI